MQEPIKVVIVLEGGIVSEVYGPSPAGVDYFVIDKDEDAEDPVHGYTWQPGMTHADLREQDEEGFKRVFEDQP